MSIFSGHPKGLFVAFFANMGERFGFYTMMAILVLFLQTRYGLDEGGAGRIYSVFYFSIYILALVGGLVADGLQKYRKTIIIGLVVMTAGYIVMALPGLPIYLVVAGLLIIAFGNGLFKGNLQALVGKLYDNPEYEHLRDSAFNTFYMGINIGAFFAPSAAVGIRNWWLSYNGYGYDKELPALCHKVIDGTIAGDNISRFQELADKALGTPVTDITGFANQYIDIFSQGYNFAFAIAAATMVISFVIFLIFQKHFEYADKMSKKTENGKKQSLFTGYSADEKQRMKALLLVFLVVIFFWMSFHQNGLTMLYFQRDYVAKHVDQFTNLFFYLPALLSVIGAIAGLVLLITKGNAKKRVSGAVLLAAGAGLTYYFYGTFATLTEVEPELFEQFNPVFVVFLTPVVLAVWAFLYKRKKEPSTPRKIGIGMILASISFAILLIGTLGLVGPSLWNYSDEMAVSPYLMIGVYFSLTVAELCLSPMGLSFVSKVAPDRLKGIMQGGWLGATALGNILLVIGSELWGWVPQISYLWGFFTICCLISAAIIFSKMKFLERVTADKPKE